jgi:hypothetical protein
MHLSVSLALRVIYTIHDMYVDVDADADVQIFEASR